MFLLFMIHLTKSQSETINLGKKIASQFKGGEIILLEGDLGAGKTTFTKGIAKYFDIKDTITSPTFTLMNIYEIKNQKSILLSNKQKIKNLVHIDTYRLENEDDLIEIGAEDYLGDPNTICLIEWPEKIKKLIQNKKTIKIKIEHLAANRKITIK